MKNPCINCKRFKNCKKMCYYKSDYLKHENRKRKENKYLYDFGAFLRWVDEQAILLEKAI